MPEETGYFTTSEERIFLDLRDSMGYIDKTEKLSNDSKLILKTEVKNPFTQKMRLCVWEYSMGEYLYMLPKSRLTSKYKTYSITSHENELEE